MNYGRKSLDDIDYRIIDLLQKDGRISMSALGREISMSSVAVADRIARLMDMGVIAGFTAVLNKDRLGLPIHAFILVDNLPPEKRREFADYVNSEPNIVANYKVMTGGKEAILNVYCETMAQMITIQDYLNRLGSISTFLVEPKATKKAIKQL